MSQVPLLRANLTTLFLVAILCIALTLSVTVAFPEMLHGFHTAHRFLHLGGMMLALFITILAGLSYRMLRSRRLLLTTVAFANFVFTESLLLIAAIDLNAVHLVEGTHIYEVGHLLMFVTLGLLALGVLRND